MRLLVITIGLCLLASPLLLGADDGVYPSLRRVRAGRGVVVRRGMNGRSAAISRIYGGAVLELRRRGRSESCRAGWFQRRGGGFVCGDKLRRTDETAGRPSRVDTPDLLEGLEAYEVVERRAKIYWRQRDIRRHNHYKSLRPGSMIIGREKLEIGGEPFLETRHGWFLEAGKLRKLPPAISTLGATIPDGGDLPGGIVIGDDALSYVQSSAEGQGTPLERWSVLGRVEGAELEVDGDWVRLDGGRYVEDSQVARVRRSPRPRRLGDDERWLAVDVLEQLFHAYEGERLVRVIPCSTGKRGNTHPGRYRIQWKRRLQTMRLRKGTLRVEDVQWVMYYHRRESIAIHSAYWHHSFGTPVSHGCVNLPPEDARWVFEFATPHARPEDSERFPSPGHPGSRVVVFD